MPPTKYPNQKGEEYSDGECWKIYNPHKGKWVAVSLNDEILLASTKKELKEIIIKHPHGYF